MTVTFDDNFGLANERASGGVDAIVALYEGKTNPSGRGNADDFDGAPARATFYHTSIYAVDESAQTLGGSYGEDHMGRNLAAWRAAREAGHEVAVHTVHHYNGGVVPLDPDDCCRPRDFDIAAWSAEIGACRSVLIGDVGADAADVSGFRAPFLGYNDALYGALESLGFWYDTSLPNCYADDEDGSNCSWPYTLDHGSPDVESLMLKASGAAAPFTYPFPEVTGHAGLWELPPTTLIIPPDSAAATYGFTAGLRARVAARPQPLPYPSMYDPASHKIAGLDYSLLIDAQLTGAEMAAILEYNLDLHLAGNRAPLVFVAHSHLYAYTEGDAEAPADQRNNPDTPSRAIRDERFAGLTLFLEHALAKPEVRVVGARDIIAWMHRATAP